jgi:predicted ATPase/DNA-binding XRE family transcriptional regulator
LRQATGLAQEELAERAGLSPNAISALERGERRHPYPNTIQALAAALGLTEEQRATLRAAVPRRLDRAEPAPVRGPLLPIPPTPLIGRDHAVAAATALLRDDRAAESGRLLTLIGPGGVGKTRLALAVAGAVADRYADGAHLISLAPVGDPASVLATIAQALGLREASERPVVDQLDDFLREREVLLVLDNFEHLAAAAPAVAALLERCPRLRLLVTSRERLRLRAEQVYPVLPLALPDSSARETLATLAGNPAVALFVARARAAQPDFALTEANAGAIAAICARLDGLPLAIELAAARVRLLPPTALLARLTRRLALLTTGAPDQPARHQTLRAAIGWSYGLLGAAEQRLFHLLGVFVGGAGLDAVEAVYDAVEGEAGAALDGVVSLVDKSLVVRTETADAAEPRVMMLETIREFALERLVASGEEAALRRAHAAYYLALAELTEPEVTGPHQRASLDRLETELDNLRAALAWALDAGDGETAMRFGGALWRFWEMRGYLSEGRRWLEAALAVGETRPSRARARALAGLAFVQMNQREPSLAAATAAEGLALWRRLDDPQGLCLGLNMLGDVRLSQGDYRAAHALFAESLACARAANDRRTIARALNTLAEATQPDNLPAAQELYAESLAIFRELDDRPGIAYLLGNLGNVARLRGDLDAARVYHEEHLRRSREANSKPHIADGLQHLGEIAHAQGDLAQAAACFTEAAPIWRAIGDVARLADCLDALAAVAAGTRRDTVAAQLWSAADSLREASGVARSPEAQVLYDRDLAAARTRCDEAAWTAAGVAGETLPVDQVVARFAETR